MTGVNGFLGTHFARHWSSLGYKVRGAARHWPDPRVEPLLDRCIALSLGEDPRPEDLTGADVVVHLAYDRKAGIESNVTGVRRVFDAANAVGVSRQIFVSSYSARPDAVSEYGRLKYQLETFFLERGQTVVRPGLVIGNGGLFGRNMDRILHTPLLPLLDSGIDLLPVVAVEDLVLAMTILLYGAPGAYNLFNRELIPMRRFVTAVNRAGRHRAVYFSIPLNWAIGALSCAARLRIRLPVDLDNLRALKQNQHCIHASDLDALVPDSRSFESMIQAAVANCTRRNLLAGWTLSGIP
jgi:NADH dehydrogenase